MVVEAEFEWELGLLTSVGCPAAAAAKSLQSCTTLCDPIDGSPTGSPVPGILQARTLEWVAISFSNSWKWKVKVKSLSRVRLLATPWTVAHQAPPSMGFSRQEYWSGVPLPAPYLLSKSQIYKCKVAYIIPLLFLMAVGCAVMCRFQLCYCWLFSHLFSSVLLEFYQLCWYFWR